MKIFVFLIKVFSGLCPLSGVYRQAIWKRAAVISEEMIIVNTSVTGKNVHF
jgi:hypothetical protein